MARGPEGQSRIQGRSRVEIAFRPSCLAAPSRTAGEVGSDKPLVLRPVKIGARSLPGVLMFPENPQGIVICAFGAGSSRESPRNIQMAEGIAGYGFAVLLFDLLDEVEALDRENVFDIGKLAGRISEALAFAQEDAALRVLPIGIFCARTGTPAALLASLSRPGLVRAIASWQGRIDLAENMITKVDTPIKLLVNKHDERLLRLIKVAFDELTCDAELELIENGGKIFLVDEFYQTTIDLVGEWFKTKMRQ